MAVLRSLALGGFSAMSRFFGFVPSGRGDRDWSLTN
jgi:hypothetical protein